MTAFHWIDTNGAVWDLTDGPVALKPGVMGLGLPGTDQFTRQSASIAGQKLTGSRVLPRNVFLPLVLVGFDARLWLRESREFFSGLSEDIPGTLRVTAGDGEVREIALRLVRVVGDEMNIDPAIFARESFGLDLVADDPFWRGPRVLRQFQAAQSSGTFYAPAGSNYVFNIGSAGNTDAAVLSNLGDVPAWATVTISGPSVAFSVVVDDAEISATLNLASGDRLVIDTDPTQQTARLWQGGVSTLFPFFNFTQIRFAPIPRGGSVPVGITVNGSGPVEIGFYPQYRRAF